MFYICSMTRLHIIWFRQDMRVHDNAALRAACQTAERDGGALMALYILPTAIDLGETENRAETSFLFESLRDLEGALAQRGAALHLRQGDVTSVFSDILRAHQVKSLHAHDGWADDTDSRDVEAWSLRAGVPFRRHPQFGPHPDARATESWQTMWERFMARPRHEAPDHITTANIGLGQWPRASSPKAETTEEAPSLRGGRKHAIQTLRSCLGTGRATVTLSSADAIAALKPYLQIGAVSPREVWQAAVGAHQQALKAGLDIRAASFASFLQLLPGLFRPESENARSRRSSHPTERNVTGQQLSLGLEQTGRSIP